MGAEDGDGRFLEPGQIEREGAGPDVRSEHWGTDAASRINAVLIGFPKDAVACVKVRRSMLDGENAHALGKGAIEGTMKVGRRDGSIEGKGSDLREGVDASIGAS